MPEISSWREADHSHERPVKWASPAPTVKAPIAPSTTDHRVAAVPEVNSHGSSGMNAPTAKATNDAAAACSGFAGLLRVDAQLLAGVGLEGEIGIPHHLDRELVGHVRVDPPTLVDGRQLSPLVLGIVADGLSFDVQLPLHQLGLGPHGDVLPRRHRERPGDQTGDAGQSNRAHRRMGAGHAQDQGDVGDQAVADAEDGGAGSAPLQVAVTVVGHIEQRTEVTGVRRH